MPSKEERHAERAGRVPPATCKCAGCTGLAKRYKSDPDLLAFYRRKLLQKGWAGQTDDVEKAYMLAHAPWYKGLVERGRETAAKLGWGEGFSPLEKASGAKDGEMATSGAEGGSQATLWPPAAP